MGDHCATRREVVVAGPGGAVEVVRTSWILERFQRSNRIS